VYPDTRYTPTPGAHQVNHPFIVRLLGSSQDAQCLHFVLEYVVGGEFFTHLRQARGY
jgi:hypothetical protein